MGWQRYECDAFWSELVVASCGFAFPGVRVGFLVDIIQYLWHISILEGSDGFDTPSQTREP